MDDQRLSFIQFCIILFLFRRMAILKCSRKKSSLLFWRYLKILLILLIHLKIFVRRDQFVSRIKYIWSTWRLTLFQLTLSLFFKIDFLRRNATFRNLLSLRYHAVDWWSPFLFRNERFFSWETLIGNVHVDSLKDTGYMGLFLSDLMKLHCFIEFIWGRTGRQGIELFLSDEISFSLWELMGLSIRRSLGLSFEMFLFNLKDITGRVCGDDLLLRRIGFVMIFRFYRSESVMIFVLMMRMMISLSIIMCLSLCWFLQR